DANHKHHTTTSHPPTHQPIRSFIHPSIHPYILSLHWAPQLLTALPAGLRPHRRASHPFSATPPSISSHRFQPPTIRPLYLHPSASSLHTTTTTPLTTTTTATGTTAASTTTTTRINDLQRRDWTATATILVGGPQKDRVCVHCFAATMIKCCTCVE
uniref:Uncharacterized protein n=1 Tax=Mesocestoides corti TaxID=53468 RepID=A0A5K3G3B7_MESCO